MTSRFEWPSCQDVLKNKENTPTSGESGGGGIRLFVAIWNKTLLYIIKTGTAVSLSDPGFECQSGRAKFEIVNNMVVVVVVIIIFFNSGL
jgi:hypothetical protein